MPGKVLVIPKRGSTRSNSGRKMRWWNQQRLFRTTEFGSQTHVLVNLVCFKAVLICLQIHISTSTGTESKKDALAESTVISTSANTKTPTTTSTTTTSSTESLRWVLEESCYVAGDSLHKVIIANPEEVESLPSQFKR